MHQTDAGLGAILVHGLWHGGWVWDAVRRDLDRAGVANGVVELPMSDLAADIAATSRVIDEFDRATVLVGHSYGGAVITDAGTHPHVAHLLYLAAYQLAEGESVGRTLPDLGIPPTRLGEALRFSDDGQVVTLDPGLAAELLFGDVPADAVSAAISRLRPVRRAVFRGVPERIAWRSRPSTYVVCAADQVVNPDLERAMAARATTRYQWPGGHSPMLTRPGTVAALIASLAERPRSECADVGGDADQAFGCRPGT